MDAIVIKYLVNMISYRLSFHRLFFIVEGLGWPHLNQLINLNIIKC